MTPNDLTTVASVKEWAGADAQNDKTDTLLARLISRVSQTILAYIQRDTLLSKSYSEIYDGTGTNKLMLRQFPVTGVSAVTMAGLSVPAFSYPAPPSFVPITEINNPYGGGYQIEQWDGYPPGRPAVLSLVGFSFIRAKQNTNVSYVAGYLQQSEAAIIPTNGQVTPLAPNGLMVADAGVTYANGTALVAVAATPAVGQYIAPNPLVSGSGSNPTTIYQFNTAENGVAVLLNYSYVPWAIEGICAELVAERWSYKGRIGQRTKTLGGQETIAFDVNDMTPYIKRNLNYFRNVAPI